MFHLREQWKGPLASGSGAGLEYKSGKPISSSGHAFNMHCTMDPCNKVAMISIQIHD